MVLPQEARFDAAAHAALVRGDMDLLLVHYVDGGYFHYDSVEFADGSSWEVASETQQRVSEILRNCPTWSALQQGDTHLARALLLSSLLAASSAEPAALASPGSFGEAPRGP